MLFNSTLFLQFYGLFLLLYFAVRNRLSARNLLVLIASYLFYGAWDYRLLCLLILSSLMDYAVGRGLAILQNQAARKALLTCSIFFNLSLLGFFKYYNFFAEGLAALFSAIEIPFAPASLRIILPVGISFYTFQTMSYAIEVYRRTVPPEKNLITFLAYVSFFPQLVAGPIERPQRLLPQFQRTLIITRAMVAEGFWLCLWGLFKKVALADNLAPLVDLAYNHPHQSGPLVFLGTVAFAFQIYCDFSGYSDIARGTAAFLGFDLLVNFDLPYRARSLQEFWRRWHISLSTWLRDYLYIPLGGNRRGAVRTALNLLLTMLLGGLWHGAAGNFLLWGFWHGTGLVFERFTSSRIPRLKIHGTVLGWICTMLFVLYGWLLFRSASVEQIVRMTGALGNWSVPDWFHYYWVTLIIFASPLLLMEIWQARTNDRLAPLKLQPWARGLLQGGVLFLIALFWSDQKSPFIYFQF